MFSYKCEKSKFKALQWDSRFKFHFERYRFQSKNKYEKYGGNIKRKLPVTQYNVLFFIPAKLYV